MNKAQLVEAIAQKTGFTKLDSERALDSIVQIIQTEVNKGEKVAVSGLGIFEKKLRLERKSQNPATKESIIVPARNVPKFKVAKAFKDAIE